MAKKIKNRRRSLKHSFSRQQAQEQPQLEQGIGSVPPRLSRPLRASRPLLPLLEDAGTPAEKRSALPSSRAFLPPRPGTCLKNGSAFVFFTLAFAILALLESERLALYLESFSPAPVAEHAAAMIRRFSRETGLSGLREQETALLARFHTQQVIGAAAVPRQAPGADREKPAEEKPETSSQPPVASGVQDAETRADPPLIDPDIPANAIPTDQTTALQAKNGTAAQTREPDQKKIVLLAGDSLMAEGFGSVLHRAISRYPNVEVKREAKYSTGLSRRDFFDWPRRMEELVEEMQPDLVILCLGANDAQDIVEPGKKRHGVGTPSWEDIYQTRAEELARAAQKKNARLIWIGLPIMGKEPLNTWIRMLTLRQKAACDKSKTALYIDTLEMLKGRDGKYAAFLEDAARKKVRVRYKDTVHLTREGGALITEQALPVILRELGIAAKADEPPASASSSGAPGASGASGKQNRGAL